MSASALKTISHCRLFAERVAAGCRRNTIAVGDIGFDIENRGLIEKIDAGELEKKPALVPDNRLKFYRRQTEMIGSMRTPSRKNTDSFLAAQPGRTDGRFPSLGQCLMKLKMDPDMGKLLQAAHHLLSIEGWQKFQARRRRGNHARLPGNTEFLGETGMNNAYGTQMHAFPSIPSLLVHRLFISLLH